MADSLDGVVEEISKRVKPAASAADLAKTVFAWMLENVQYDYDRKRAINEGRDQTYVRRPEEVLRQRKGVCGDQAALYVAICSRLGLDAKFAHVAEDQNGQSCNHACALVRINDRWVQVDPSYQVFGANHRQYTIKGGQVASEPDAVNHIMTIIADNPWLRKTLLAVSTAGLCLAAGIAYEYGIPRSKADVVETEEGLRFFTRHGSLHYRILPEARERWEESIFFMEKTSGALPESKLLGVLLDADKNGDNCISAEEASISRLRARSGYRQDGH